MAPISLSELARRRLRAAEERANALKSYEAVRLTLARKQIDTDADPAAIYALADYEEAQARFEVARREHGIAIAADLKAREQGQST